MVVSSLKRGWFVTVLGLSGCTGQIPLENDPIGFEDTRETGSTAPDPDAGIPSCLDGACTDRNLLTATLPSGWTAADIGPVEVSGSTTFDPATGTFEVTGQGIGWNAAQLTAPRQFCYQQRSDDFELVARLVSESGAELSHVGLYLAETLPTTSTDRVIPGFALAEADSQYGPPLWLMIRRVGDRVGTFVSQDGLRWASARDGTRLSAPRVTVSVGLFARSDSHTQRATARFDNVSIRAPTTAFTTSWLANFGPGHKLDHLPRSVVGIITLDKGTFMAVSDWDEAGFTAGIYKDGRNTGYVPGLSAGREGALAVAGTKAYVAKGATISEVDITTLKRSGRTLQLAGTDAVVSGLVARPASDELFVANKKAGRIEVWSLSGWAKTRDLTMMDRPARMCLDPRGDLWVVQSAEPTNAGRVVRLDPVSGAVKATVTGTTGWVPGGISCDNRGPRGPRLLVPDNGPDQNVKIYDVSSTPVLHQTLGQKGGVWGGAVPGADAPDKLMSPDAVATDPDGLVFVSEYTSRRYSMKPTAASRRHATVRAFAASGQLLWKVWAYTSWGNVAINPQDEREAYSSEGKVFSLDYSQSAGREARLRGIWENQPAFRDDVNFAESTSHAEPFVAHIGGRRFLFSRSLGGRLITAYRFTPATSGDLAIPCFAWSVHRLDGFYNWLPVWPEGIANTSGHWMWRDGMDGSAPDGKAQLAEIVDLSAQRKHWSADVLQNGDIVGAVEDSVRYSAASLDAHGIPLYSVTDPDPLPSPIWRAQQVRFDLATDTLWVLGESDVRARYGHIENHAWGSSPTFGTELTNQIVRYDGWRSGARTPRFTLALPYSHPAGSWNGSLGPSYFPTGFALAGDFLFLGLRSNPGIRVYDMRTGHEVAVITPGHEVYGDAAQLDIEAASVKAYRRSNGEYIITAEDDGGAKYHLYRWTPDANRLRRAYGNGGAPWSVSLDRTTRIQAEDFDTGGPGISYIDTTSRNEGGTYRPQEAVDIQRLSDNSGYNVGWTKPGEVLEYTVDVRQTGLYDVRVRAATALRGPRTVRITTFDILNDYSLLYGMRTVAGPLSVPTNGWQAFTTLEQRGVLLGEGVYALRVEFPEGAVNLDWIELVPRDNLAPRSHWPLDGNLRDISGFNHAWDSRNAQVPFVADADLGRSAAQFDGTRAINLPTPLITTARGSLAVKVRTQQNSKGMVFFASRVRSDAEGAGRDQEVRLEITADGKIAFFMSGGSRPNLTLTSSIRINDNRWHRVTATWDSAGEVKLYIDGVLATSGVHPGHVFGCAVRMRLGMAGKQGTAGFVGSLSDVRLYRSVLTASEIGAL